jgi:uncharacterized membrane protein
MATYGARRKTRASGSPEQLARGLAWLSIGLGIAQVLAPRTVARLVGVPIPVTLTMLCGVREIASGIGILTQEDPAPWMRARIAGDALDLAGIAAGLMIPDADRRRIAVATAAIAGVTAADVYCSRALSQHGRRSTRHVIASIQVDRSPGELYRFWRDLGNLPRLMPHLDSVQVLDEVHSHWIARGPAGTRVEWDSEIIDEAPDERLAWRSVEGSQIYNAGSVQFARAGSGTRVTVELLYDPPAGSLGAAVAKLLGGGADDDVHADLRAFKHFMESGQNPAAASS